MEKTTPAFFEPRVGVGEEGVARTLLRPAGKAEFGAALVDVVTDGEFLERGAKVRVVLVEGDRGLWRGGRHRARVCCLVRDQGHLVNSGED